MKRSPQFLAAMSALLFSLSCAPDEVAQDGSTSTGSSHATAVASEAGESGPEADIPPPATPWPGGVACQVDADCDAGDRCELRLCVAGCVDATTCDAGQVCDPHGRCQVEESDAQRPVHAGTPTLGERQTLLPLGETQVRTLLRNDGVAPLAYRITAASPALALDAASAELAPGAEIELVADIDLAALTPDDRVLPIQIITSGGAILWTIEIEALPSAGHFRGAVNFTAADFSLGSSDLAVDLDFRPNGTIVGRVDNDVSLLWPLPLALTGTWTAAGDVVIELRDRLPADGWRQSPIGRELGRVLVLTGTRTAAGIEGIAAETISGLRTTAVPLAGAFTLRRQGPLVGIVHAPDFIPKDAPAPTWLAPPGLDTDACEGLGTAYGTAATLPKPEPACNACKFGNGSPEEKVQCGVRLREAAYNIEDMLAALDGGGDVAPPAGAWTWEITAEQAPASATLAGACLTGRRSASS